LKWIRVSSPFFSAGQAFTTDVGALVHLDRERWKFGFGAMYQNLGGDVEFEGDDRDSPLVRTWKLGASVMAPLELTDVLTLGGVAVVDYNRTNAWEGFREAYDTLGGGVEGYITHTDVLRLAVRGGYYYDPTGDIEDFTYGAGIRAWMLSVDGGWIPQARAADLDRVFKITAGIHVDLSTGEPIWQMD
jgi:hypothetical protein